MSCGCVYTGDDDWAGFCSEEIRKAVKEHRCSECKNMIAKGEKYERTAGCWDGYWSVYKTCQDCLSIRKEFFCGSWRYGAILDDLYDYIQEVGGEIKSECLERLTLKAKENVIDMIDEFWERDDEFMARYKRLHG